MILVMLEEQVSSNEWLALHDELTGLPNRRLFADRLSLAIERADRIRSRLALLILDLNGFKSDQRHAWVIRPATRCCARCPAI